MKKRIKIGDRFGRLTVIAKGRKEGNYRFYVVQCSCGSPAKEVNGISLTSGSTTSCGCKRREVYAKIGKKNRKFPKCPFCGSTKLFNHGLCYKHYLQWLRGEFTDDQTRLYELALKKPQLLTGAKRKTIDNDCFWMRYIHLSADQV